VDPEKTGSNIEFRLRPIGAPDGQFLVLDADDIRRSVRNAGLVRRRSGRARRAHVAERSMPVLPRVFPFRRPSCGSLRNSGYLARPPGEGIPVRQVALLLHHLARVGYPPETIVQSLTLIGS